MGDDMRGAAMDYYNGGKRGGSGGGGGGSGSGGEFPARVALANGRHTRAPLSNPFLIRGPPPDDELAG